MGVVYEAAHAKTGGIYALKTLPTASAGELLSRFLREGEAQARLDGQPNVVSVHSLSADQIELSNRISRRALTPSFVGGQ